jgi:uncharacterized membrane protein
LRGYLRVNCEQAWSQMQHSNGLTKPEAKSHADPAAFQQSMIINEFEIGAQVECKPSGPAPVSKKMLPRIASIDLLRGTVMVVMALDHTHDFFLKNSVNPRDVTDPALFLTRWITHFCAPVFVLLAGVAAYLYGARNRSGGMLRRFLLTRGLWLIFVELIVVRLGFSFSLDLNLFVAQVIWALGFSMIVLSFLIHLPRWAVAFIALVMIGSHNLFDGINGDQLGAVGWIWHVLHQPGFVQVGPSAGLFVLYPLVPWIGVMAGGYALGPLFERELDARRRRFATLGIVTLAGFVALRASNLYGDPQPWSMQSSWLSTLLSFVNCEKYPPSLLYLAMTLGPALLFLALFERARGRVADFIMTYGRVPLIYYVAHIFLIHAAAVVLAWVQCGTASFLIRHGTGARPPAYGLSLAGVYLIWLLVVAALYPLCRRFADLKRRRSDWWLSYL